MLFFFLNVDYSYYLTPKGLNIHTTDKPVLGKVTWSQFLFLFLKLFVKMDLGISFAGVQILYFSDLQIKS
jgi:hypothetical protein